MIARWWLRRGLGAVVGRLQAPAGPRGVRRGPALCLTRPRVLVNPRVAGMCMPACSVNRLPMGLLGALIALNLNRLLRVFSRVVSYLYLEIVPL